MMRIAWAMRTLVVVLAVATLVPLAGCSVYDDMFGSSGSKKALEGVKQGL